MALGVCRGGFGRFGLKASEHGQIFGGGSTPDLAYGIVVNGDERTRLVSDSEGNWQTALREHHTLGRGTGGDIAA